MAGWRESLRKRTGMITVEIILQFSLRGQKKSAKAGKRKVSPVLSLPKLSPFSLLPIPYPFRRLLLRLIRVCHNLVCAACAKILKAGNFSSIFCERVFLLFASRWLRLTDGDLLTAYSTLSSVFCKQLFIVSLTIVSL